ADRLPVIDPAAAVELRLAGGIEAQRLLRTLQLQQKPALFLADAQRQLIGADEALRQAVAQPVLGAGENVDVSRDQPDLLLQLPVKRGLGLLATTHAALGELPAAPAAAAAEKQTPVGVHQHDADVGPEPVAVDHVTHKWICTLSRARPQGRFSL